MKLLFAIALLAMMSTSGIDGRVVPTPSEVLNRAHAFLGAPAAVAAVRSLELVQSHQTTRILFPDLYQFELDSGGSKTLISFDGVGMWRRPAADRPPEDPAAAKRKGVRFVAEQALAYLARPLPPFAIGSTSLAAIADCAETGGVCLRFSEGGSRPIYMSFDSASGSPVALIRPLADASGTSGGMGVVLFEDYRVVSGVKVPFRTRARMVRQPGIPDREIGPTVFSEIRLNPKLSRSDFQKQ
jgi:hypothetical protein